MNIEPGKQLRVPAPQDARVGGLDKIADTTVCKFCNVIFLISLTNLFIGLLHMAHSFKGGKWPIRIKSSYFQEAPSLGETKNEDFSQSRNLTLECGGEQRLKW